ncbi:MAG: GNAT family N-acetyltransferase [Candidatus Bathyarchaeia archaeon]
MEGPRAARRDELQQVADLANLVFREAKGLAWTMHLEFPLLFNEANLENLRVILDDGKPVTLVGIRESELVIYGCRVPVGMIGSVCTHPQYRGKGLASLALVDAFEKMKRDGVPLVLVSGVRSLYTRAGCAMVGREYRYGLTPQDAEKLPTCGFELEPFQEGALSGIVELRQKEPVRFLNTPEELLALLKRPERDSLSQVHPRDTFLIKCGSTSVAYLVAQMPRDGSLGDSNLVEYGGSRSAVAAGVSLLIRRRGLRKLNVAVPWQDKELLALLELAGLPLPKASPFGGTVKLLQPQAFLKAVKPYLRERLGVDASEDLRLVEGAENLRLEVDGESLPLKSDLELARLLFGTPDVSNAENEAYLEEAPKPRAGSRLAEVVERALPLPTIRYGLNFT